LDNQRECCTYLLHSAAFFNEKTIFNARLGRTRTGYRVGLYFENVLGKKAAGDARSYALAVGLIVLSGFLMLVSWVRMLITTSSAWAPVWGLLTGTIWIAGWISCDRVASILGSARGDVRQFTVAALVLIPLMALRGGRGGQVDSSAAEVMIGSLLGVETVGCLICLQMTRASQRADAG
jgi:hypothetical protein